MCTEINGNVWKCWDKYWLVITPSNIYVGIERRENIVFIKSFFLFYFMDLSTINTVFNGIENVTIILYVVIIPSIYQQTKPV